MRRAAWPRAGLLAVALAVLVLGAGTRAGQDRRDRVAAGSHGCLACHSGIEEIHPGYELSCVDCHGGDATAQEKERAHVLPRERLPNDERVLPEHHDLPWQRFRNPSNLRVAGEACAPCHARLVEDVKKSLHGTTAGHLGDGYYENGLEPGRKPRFGVFPVRDDDGFVPPGAQQSLEQVPAPRAGGDRSRIETHYADLPRKACMNCHLHSEGRAVRGRLGMDGDYRSQGCAACHVTYADDGRSRSGDPTIDKFEPGHGLQHRFTKAIPTGTCVHCHYGDATIGLHFRGLAQLVPGQPAGPDVPGTTDSLQNGVFYVRDPELTPPDLHHAAGMHCIDCHTARDTMGDGDIHVQMEHAVEIECTTCHGDFERTADLLTGKGRRVANLFREGESFFLVSKVTGRKHPVKQARHVLDEKRPEFNARAAAAMTARHAGLECYTCHSSWNVNFFGFHFDRNEQFTQLDLISGKRTPGRVSTQEKVFATFNQLRLGVNSEGAIAPFMVGFSTTGTAHDAAGRTVMRQAMPRTAAGLSGMTMIHHQMHTTSSRPRTCVECHRSPATYGMGSPNFRLTRELAYALTGDGLHVLALDAKNPQRSFVAATLPLPGDPRAIALELDPVTASATHAFVACGDGRLRVVDLANPLIPRRAGEVGGLADPRELHLAGTRLFVADGVGGLVIVDVSRPRVPKVLAAVPSVEARAVEVDFPIAYVADGAGGLVLVDFGDDAAPRVVSHLDVNGDLSAPNEALDVAVFFQYSRPGRPGGQRTPARKLAFVAAGLDGLRVADVTEPAIPRLLEYARGDLARLARADVRGVAAGTVFDLGSAGGQIKSQENDYVYAWAEQGPADNRQQFLHVVNFRDVQAPAVPRGRGVQLRGGTGRLRMARFYNAPFLQHFVAAVGAGGGAGTLCDVSKAPVQVAVAGSLGTLEGVRDLAFEEMAFDRMIDEDGRPQKDISHEGARYLTRAEVRRLLAVDLGVERPRYPVQPVGRRPAEEKR